VVLIGHAGHPEVVGTMGQLPDGAISLIESVEDVAAFEPRDAARLSFVTQTTLSVDDTSAIVEALQARFPDIKAPHKEDICYATTNRQSAVKTLAPQSDIVFVIGAPNSSNSVRLVEVAQRAGAKRAMLVSCAADVDWNSIGDVRTIGITAGASAPEDLVQGLIDAFRERFEVELRDVRVTDEDVVFKLPRAVA
jgi:4-hydroxy-3-methylbut-2-enyl diphosphate reductase